MKKINIILLIITFQVFLCLRLFADNDNKYEVVCKEEKGFIVRDGKCIQYKGEFQVNFIVDEVNNLVTRTKVINFRTKLVTEDGSQYQVVYNQPTIIGMEYFWLRNPTGILGSILQGLDKNPKTINQKIIKAVGQVGTVDGFETIVIGEDFVIQSRSTLDYFVVVSSKRYKSEKL